jgi:hypothetical protein
MEHVSNKHMKLHKYVIKTGTAPAGRLLYANSENTRVEAGLILARIRLRWQIPGE